MRAGVAQYLADVAAGNHAVARDRMSELVEREGLGAVNGALGDACRNLLDRLPVGPGSVDVRTEVHRIATRVVELAGVTEALVPRLRALIVFLESGDLPSAARTEVASWLPVDRTDALVRLTVGLAAMALPGPAVALGTVLTDAALAAPPEAEVPTGRFGLAANSGDPLDPRIVFVADTTCTLRGIFARVARLAATTGSAVGQDQAASTASVVATVASNDSELVSTDSP